MSIVDRLEVAVPNLNRSKICGDLVCRDLTEPAEQFLDRTGKRIRQSVVELVYAMADGEFAALVAQVPDSSQDPRALSRLATQLLSHSERCGNAAIQHRIDRQFCRLAANGVNERALVEMKAVLKRISNPERVFGEDNDAKLAI